MAAADITQFAAIFVASVNGRLGAAAPTADLTAFTAAAQNLAMVASAPPSAAAWAAASDGWTMARDRPGGPPRRPPSTRVSAPSPPPSPTATSLLPRYTE